MKSKAPRGWVKRRLDENDLASVIMGQSPPSSSYNESQMGLPFMQGNAEFGFFYASPRLYTTEPAKIAKKDDILLSIRAPVGELNFAPTLMCIGRGLAAIRTNHEKLDRRYTYYWLKKNINSLLAKQTGSTFKAVRGEDIRELLIDIPPLVEQRGIAEVLGTVDEAIKRTDAVIEKANELKRGLMQRLLTKGIGHTEYKQTELGEIPKTWSAVKTGNVCQILVPGRNKPKNFGGNIPWITIPDFEGDYISNSKSGLYVDREEIKQIGNKIIPVNSVIMTCVGKFGIVAINTVELVINQQLHAFVCSNKIIPYYLMMVLRLKTKYMYSVASTTIVPYINKEKCLEIHIALPSINEQHQISDIIRNSQYKIDHDKRRLSYLYNIKNGLMQVLLSGRVRVRLDEGGIHRVGDS